MPGHCEVKGNELADKLAKDASKNAKPNSNIQTFALLKSKIKRLKTNDWNNILIAYSNTHKTHGFTSYNKAFVLAPKSKIALDSDSNYDKSTTSAFYQMKLEHGYNKVYLKRLGHVENDLCECGGKETSEHLLLYCSLYNKERNKLKDQMKVRFLTKKLLLNTQAGIKATLAFIKATGVCTRRWHLSRADDSDLDPFLSPAN